MHMISRVVVVLCLSALVLNTGCKSKKNRGGLGSDMGDTTVLEEVKEDGIPLTGEPFDANHERVTDANLTPVYFGYDSFQLAPEEIAKIEQVADYLNSNSDCVLIVEGHCDERGSNEYNLSLGEQRALAVRSYLVNLGIAAERIQSRSFGEERPAVAGSDESAWRLNRRGEFALYK
ncbi:MAG: OmpA family protein [Kiritimatiellae bacterium]|nr:OmpA family protein [Kiritimatiellia bacterium]